MANEFKIDLGDGQTVTGLAYPPEASSRKGLSVVLGHGAGASQTSAFMVLFSVGLAERGIDAFTFNFNYTERGRRLPDPGPKLEACYRAVAQTVMDYPAASGNKLIIGGKSMGGRIASQIAAGGQQGLSGLVCLGYPLHPPGRPEKMRDKHLADISAPILIVQGSRDTFGTPDELRPVIAKIKAPCELYEIEGGDHSFKVPKRGPLTQDQIYAGVLDRIASWAASLR
jgi:predicted alpha/beta-hydrolase family hydrolase